MHLVCLGVMKNLLTTWVTEKYTKKTKLSGRQLLLLTKKLQIIAAYCPREFARRPTSINEYHKFKATGYRQIFLYTGIVILKDILEKSAYIHFLLSHAALRILVSPSASSHQLEFAKIAISKFVKRCILIYGPIFMSYNIHGLLHLVEDVNRFGPLDSHSAFPYENNMMYFRKLCRKPHLQLQQIARRRTEEDIIARRNIPVNEIDTSIKTWGKHKDPLASYDIPCLTNYYQYRSVKTSEFFLDQSQRDNCCILYDLRVCKVVKILSNNKDYYLVVKVFNSVCDFHDIGINSSSVGIFKCSEPSDKCTVPLKNV